MSGLIPLATAVGTTGLAARPGLGRRELAREHDVIGAGYAVLAAVTPPPTWPDQSFSDAAIGFEVKAITILSPSPSSTNIDYEYTFRSPDKATFVTITPEGESRRRSPPP